MKLRQISVLSAVCWAAGTGLAFAQGQTLTIATVNNADMIIMQRLSPKWE
jgi:sorbitol/mannitol transport system substrate-binding protein